MKLIANKIAKNGLSINEVTKLTFIVLSSKHSWLNENLYLSIPEIFSKAGMQTFGVQYLPPRFIFWNLSRFVFFYVHKHVLSIRTTKF